MISSPQIKNVPAPLVNWPTLAVADLPLAASPFEGAEICEDLQIDSRPSTILELAPSHLHYAYVNGEVCCATFSKSATLVKEQYARLSSLSFNQENLPAGNVVDRHNCDGSEAAHLQRQGDDDAMPVTSNDQTDDEVLFLEPEFVDSKELMLNYSDSYHPLNCQCVKLKLDSSLVIYISPAKKIALLLNK